MAACQEVVKYGTESVIYFDKKKHLVTQVRYCFPVSTGARCEVRTNATQAKSYICCGPSSKKYNIGSEAIAKGIRCKIKVQLSTKRFTALNGPQGAGGKLFHVLILSLIKAIMIFEAQQ